MGIGKNGIISNNTKLNYLVNNFTETKTSAGWSFSSNCINSDGVAVITGTSPGFNSVGFTVNPTDIIVFEFTLSLPTPSTTTSGPGIYLGTTYGVNTNLYCYDKNTDKYLIGDTNNTNPYFIYGYNSSNIINVKTYIIGSDVDINQVPSTECNISGHRIFVLQPLDKTTVYIRSGYNTNTSMVIHLSNTKIYNLKQVGFAENDNIAKIGCGYIQANNFYEI